MVGDDTNTCYRHGINSTHLAFIQRGHLIIICLVPRQGSLQLSPADTAFAVRENSPCILVVFCSVSLAEAIPSFPTILRSDEYSPSALEATAALLFDDEIHTPRLNLTTLSDPSQVAPGSSRNIPLVQSVSAPRLWPVEEWNEARDISGVWDLWGKVFKAPFDIDEATLGSLLRRPGYAKHYVVLRFGEVLGFCATYLSYVDKEGENLIASLAVLIVHPTYMHQGIGLSLHSHSMAQLRRTRGIIRLQLGSAFPRLFYGPPANIPNESWFHRRGWRLNKHDVAGKGHLVYDLILDISDWRFPMLLLQSRPVFRPCKQEEMPKVLQVVEATGKMCWFDQYLSLMNSPNVEDIIIATESGNVIAVALTYTPTCGSQVSQNLPWASHIGNDVGGITCICISRTYHLIIVTSQDQQNPGNAQQTL